MTFQKLTSQKSLAILSTVLCTLSAPWSVCSESRKRTIHKKKGGRGGVREVRRPKKQPAFATAQARISERRSWNANTSQRAEFVFQLQRFTNSMCRGLLKDPSLAGDRHLPKTLRIALLRGLGCPSGHTSSLVHARPCPCKVLAA